jgi:MoxR-like ATPase
VQVSDALLNYVQALIAATRNSMVYTSGLSPRAGLALLHAAKAWAFISGRDFVIPEDVQAVLGPVVNHRLRASREVSTNSHFDVGRALIQAVPIP